MRNKLLATAAVLAAAADAGSGASEAPSNGKGRTRTNQGNVYLMEDGKATRKARDVVEAYKAEAEAEPYNVLVTVEDEEIEKIISNVPGDEREGNITDVDHPHNKRVRAIVHRSEKEDLQDLSAAPAIDTPAGAMAVALGKMIPQDVDDLLDERSLGKQRYEGAPLQLAHMLAKAWGAEYTPAGRLKSCETAYSKIPYAGTREAGQNAKKAPNQPRCVPKGYQGPFDKYKFHDQEDKERTGWFMRDLHNSTKHGKHHTECLDEAKEAVKAKGAGFTFTKPEVKARWDEGGLDGLMNYIKTTSNLIVLRINRLTRAVMFLQQVHRWSSMLPAGIYWAFVTEDLEMLYRSNAPIKVSYGDPDDPPSTKTLANYSLTQFLTFNIYEARDNGVTFKDLIPLTSTLKKKEPATPAGDNKTLPDAPKVAQFVMAFHEANITPGNTLRADWQSYLLDISKSTDDEKHDRFLAIAQGMSGLIATWQGFQHRANLALDAKNKKEEKAAAAKALADAA